MKKTLVIIALALVGVANAQKGTVLVAGSVGYNSQKEIYSNSESINKNFNISPKVGYQFNDQWTVGVESSISHNKYNYGNNQYLGRYGINGFSAGAFVRYAKPLSEIFSVFADLGAGFHNVKRSDVNFDGFTYTTTTYKGDGLYVGVTPALFINIKKNFGLNFNLGGLGYNTYNYNNNNNNDYRNFYFNFGQSINIGISKNF